MMLLTIRNIVSIGMADHRPHFQNFGTIANKMSRKQRALKRKKGICHAYSGNTSTSKRTQVCKENLDAKSKDAFGIRVNGCKRTIAVDADCCTKFATFLDSEMERKGKTKVYFSAKKSGKG